MKRALPEYLALNPSGKIPTLVEDDFVLTESIAINAYLAGGQPNGLMADSRLAIGRQSSTNGFPGR